MSNALLESFNVMVSNSRCMLFMDLLEDIRVRLMVSLAEKKLFGQNIHTILCPKKENELHLLLKEGMHWRINRSDMDFFFKLGRSGIVLLFVWIIGHALVFNGSTNVFHVLMHCKCCSMIIMMYLSMLKITGR